MGPDEDILGLNSTLAMEVPLDVKYGTKTLTADAIKRLQDVEKLTMSTITLIDKRWQYGDDDNFANPDEVGHTGNYQATINGLQAIDVCLGKILETAEENFYKVIIVGSHAKADTITAAQNSYLI